MGIRKVLVTVIFVCSGCASIKPAVDVPDFPVPQSYRVSVGVLPFETTDSLSSRAKFESLYGAAQLVEALRTSPWVSRVYFQPNPTHHVDFWVRGRTLSASGEDTVVQYTVYGRDGKKVFDETESVSIDRDDLKGGRNPASSVHVKFADEFADYIEDLDLEELAALEDMRVRGYLSPADAKISNAQISEEARVVAEKISRTYQEQVFAPASEILLTQLPVMRTVHLRWEDEILEAQARADQEAQSSRVRLFLSIISGLSAEMSSRGNSLTSTAAPSLQDQANAEKMRDSFNTNFAAHHAASSRQSVYESLSKDDGSAMQASTEEVLGKFESSIATMASDATAQLEPFRSEAITLLMTELNVAYIPPFEAQLSGDAK